jgi:hypothetical protein
MGREASTTAGLGIFALSSLTRKGSAMTAFNAVRFKVKPGRDEDFLAAHKAVERNWPGLRHANMIKTGDGTYCIIGEWDDMDSLAEARPFMLKTLDTFRETLEGDTDPVSGPVVAELR